MSSQTSAEVNVVATAGGHGGSLELPLRVASDPNIFRSFESESAGFGQTSYYRKVGDGLRDENPFSRSHRMARSPPLEIVRTVPEAKSTEPMDLDLELASQNQGTLRERLNSLRQKIDSLQEFTNDKKNIHHEIKRMIRSVKLASQEVMDEARKVNWGEARAAAQPNSIPVATAATQTDVTTEKTATPFRAVPNGNSNTEKRRREAGGAKKDSSPKQKRQRKAPNDDTPKTSRRDEVPSKGKDGDKKRPDASKQKTSRKDEIPSKRKDGGKKMSIRPKADAIVVEKVGETSYADILRAVKTDPNLKEMGEKVVRIRKTQKGQMAFELKKEDGIKRDDLQAAVSKALGNSAMVMVRKHEVNIVCKDMDEITTKDELLAALGSELKMSGIPESAIKSMRGSFGGTQTAIISLPYGMAKKAVAAGKIKIGWTVCRLREATRPNMCFRCLDFGHMAKDCKNTDRSKLCRRCGEEGHIAKDCQKDPRCMLCKEDSKKPHITGSSRCPRYRSATKTMRT